MRKDTSTIHDRETSFKLVLCFCHMELHVVSVSQANNDGVIPYPRIIHSAMNIEGGREPLIDQYPLLFTTPDDRPYTPFTSIQCRTRG